MWHMHDAGWGWWLLMSIGMIAFWLLVIYGLVWLVRGEAVGRSRPDEASPELLLERRLASGEIDVDEYARLRRALGDEPLKRPGGGPAPAPR